jgi:putative transposase
MCARLDVSTSAFYAWREHQTNPTAKMSADAELTATIVTIHQQPCGVYGSPRVHAELVLGLGPEVEGRSESPTRWPATALLDREQ